MKRIAGLLLVAAFIAVSALISFALHSDIAVPYESVFFGQKSTMPIAAGGDLRHHITSNMPYKKEFSLYPGKGELVPGTEPHGSLITMYINERALDSVKKSKKTMANNSIVIKENYAPDKKLMAVTVMYKVKGYNPDAGDWFWVKYGPEFNILAEGKLERCIECHSQAKNNDYIFHKR